MIFSYDSPSPLPEAQREAFTKQYQWVDTSDIPEAQIVGGIGLYHGSIGDINDIASIKSILDQYGISAVVGVWYQDTGVQYGYLDKNGTRDPNIPTIPYPFDINEYRTYLPGQPPPEQAEQMQINKWAGQGDRDLATHAV